MTVPDLLSHGVAFAAGRQCVVEGDRSLTFAEVDQRADLLAGAFAAQGLVPGDRVALLARSELEFLEIRTAAQRAGLVFVPLDHRLAGSELQLITADCRPQLLIHGPGLADVAQTLGVPATWHLGAAGVGSGYDAILGQSEPVSHRDELQASRPSVILYTSGTTGRPKGVVLTNATLWARLRLSEAEIAIADEDSLLFPIPMFHASSVIAAAFTARGCTVVQMRSFDIDGAIALMEEHRLTHTVLVPTILTRLLDGVQAQGVGLEDLHMVIYGGSPISPQTLRRAVAVLGCRFLQCYGLTEAVNASVLRPEQHDPERHPELLSSAGTAATSYEVRVVDAAGAPVPAGETGEVVVRGPGVMDHYWNAPEQTARALRDGWLHTGDVGWRSADGFLHITDRMTDMIVSGGENIYAREIEDVLHAHPDVAEAAVIGIPSDTWGEEVHAVVVARDGAPADPDDLLAYCRGHLAAYKIPKSIEVCGHLEKNALGKVVKRGLRDRYWQGRERAVG